MRKYFIGTGAFICIYTHENFTIVPMFYAVCSLLNYLSWILSTVFPLLDLISLKIFAVCSQQIYRTCLLTGSNMTFDCMLAAELLDLVCSQVQVWSILQCPRMFSERKFILSWLYWVWLLTDKKSHVYSKFY